MSRISDQIREYVNDKDVSEHYGKWGIMRRDQRLLIRKLCDTCDMFERAADKYAMLYHNIWISVDVRLPEPYIDVITYDTIEFFEVNYLTKDGVWARGVSVSHWMPLPDPPMKT